MQTKRKAVEIVQGVYKNEDYASLSLQNVNVNNLNIGFLTELVYGTLRNHRLVRYFWQQFVEDELSDDINALLDVSVYMLIYLEKMPVYAIVNEMVELSKEINHGKYVGLVNAVLKKVSRLGDYHIEVKDASSLALASSFPDWLIKMLIAHYGYEQTKAFAFDSLNEGKNALRLNDPGKRSELLATDLYQEGKIVSDALYYQGNVVNTLEFKNNIVSIQDEASQLVAYFLNPSKGDKILDMCAAPGNKTSLIAQLAEDQLDIDAVDIHQHRVDLIEQAKETLALSSIKTYTYDSVNIAEILPVASYDKVLLDAPCSGLGVLKQKPEIKLRIQPTDIDDLEKIQKSLLESAAKMVRVGGEIIYSTCTYNKKENERQVQNFLTNHPNFVLVEEKTILGMEYQTDTFYMAKLKHKEKI